MRPAAVTIATARTSSDRRGRVGAGLALAAALALLVSRSWRIDQPYSIDFRVYHAAGQRVAAGQARALYEPLEVDDSGQRLALPRNEFKNVPLVALLFTPFAGLPYLEAKRVFWFVSLGCLGGAGWMTGRALARLSGRTDAVLPLAVTALLAASAPAHIALRHGQLTPIALVGLAGFLALAARGRDAAGGAVLAGACLLKIPLLAPVAGPLLRGRFRLVAGFAACGAGAVLLSVALFGWPLHAAYLGHLLSHATTGISGHNNQSLEGVFQRLLAGGGLQDWTPRAETPAVFAARWGTGLILAAGLLVAMRRARNGEPARRFALEAGGFVCLGLLLSPVAWDHYFLFAVAALPWFAWAASSSPSLRSAPLRVLGAGRGSALAWAGGLVAAPLLLLPTPRRVLESEAPGLAGQILLCHYAAGAAALLLFSSAALGRQGATRA